ncbi:MAG: hypothetical protein KDD67_03755 [Ignavibacteriae bacterium]|nr:hypothetical protein [Ignavibacteriota bacterium]MCB9215043.1 hypothetical protein [Ignavibacteria bacterium]
MFQNQTTQQIVNFIRGIGIEVRRAELTEPTFLPGILIDCGALVVDESKLLYPGDLLHEAGHIAVSPPERRSQQFNSAGEDQAEEIMAIAWSWAALLHLELDPKVVFHEGGYRGGGDAFIENFQAKRYVGVPMLQWVGMTYDEKQAPLHNAEPYPHMEKWVRERGIE